ncbi:hypothetical protein SERLA73DRAFT_191083 [Serpula lacrymans var. lacrymans S7.3]|uniref:AB hydrolase-1 domain-containing protein n=2 Tax=Serpula lacrymans var. lacrymans TaxID=341189 RepID=F8QGW4_SERL3|nr:uncharacterized protein SERLADRAFT_480679 [Serpula lacrymans var. lacrymans S7.9]EGN92446.1 hypothetical protein SERLA73DRAFT_191083 [Serpula lacrymans var. lacrymans S7.3]EGO18573.1 hypothetical protein SERLADRAFT_480679 [Serpula lacrymans var. lacrymans S7.9]
MVDASSYKALKSKRGFNYHYLSIPAKGAKPTLLLVHGFPSTSHDWHYQIEYFSAQGFGLIVPDMLGYGQTDKPEDVKAYNHFAMSDDIIDILDAENVGKVVAIGHDWGSVLITSLSIRHSDRFIGFAWLAAAYVPPVSVYNVDLILEMQTKAIGVPLMGYWKFFEQDSAATTIENNIDTFINLLYPHDPELWKTAMRIPGNLQPSVERGDQYKKADYLSEEHYTHIRSSLLKGGLTSPLNWYKSAIQGVNREDVLAIAPESLQIKKPAFYGCALKDYVCVPAMSKAIMEKFATNGLTLVDFDTGHWAHVESPTKVNEELEKWVGSIVSA